MNLTNKLLTALNELPVLTPDNWSREHKFESGRKRWLANILPSELLSRSIKQTVESLVTLCECEQFYQSFPDIIETPD